MLRTNTVADVANTGVVKIDAGEGVKIDVPISAASASEVAGLVDALAGKQDVTVTEGADYVYAITDEADKVAVGVAATGETFLRRSDAADVREVHAFILAGQSNMSGRARPFEGRDVPDRRVYQYGAKSRSLGRATVPLDMPDNALGLSYASVFAREYLARAPEGVALLLIPCADGGTGFTSTTEDPAPEGYSTNSGTWQVGYTDSAVNLYDNMLTQTTEALAVAEAFFNVTPTVKALMWHQGETDAMNGVTESAYSDYLKALIDGVRAHVGNSDLPVVMGGMSPDWMDTYPDAAPIHNALMSMELGRPRVATVPGRAGLGRYGDEIHYGLDGVEDLGVRSLRGYYAAIANDSDYPAPSPVPTSEVTAVRQGTGVRVQWGQALCRVSHYDVQYRTDGGAWVEVAFPNTRNRDTVFTVPEGHAEVRIGTDYLGTVAYSAPVPVIGG